MSMSSKGSVVRGLVPSLLVLIGGTFNSEVMEHKARNAALGRDYVVLKGRVSTLRMAVTRESGTSRQSLSRVHMHYSYMNVHHYNEICHKTLTRAEQMSTPCP
jgi:hypothetical protein